MKKSLNKKLIYIAVSALLAFSFIISIAASSSTKAVGNVGEGTLNVQSATKITAWTTANSSGTFDSDYVLVNYWGYTAGSTVWGPGPNGESGDSYAVKREGKNWVEAYASDSQAGNIKSGDSYHEIRRNNVTYSTRINGISVG